jgi:arylsulfatase A
MKLAAALLIFFAAAALPAAEAAKPNLVLIFIDDLGYADIGPFGNTEVRTPHLDRMAQEGMRFTSFYATPVCSMSRACLMTGCYNTRVSVPGVLFPYSDTGLHPDEITLAEVVKPQGYVTKCIGKWHLGWQPEFLPTRQGFDSYFGIPYSNDMHAGKNNYPPLPLIRDETTIETEPDQSQLTRRYTEEATQFIRDHKDQPFFLYLPHTMVHLPLAASQEFLGKSQTGLIGDATEEIDWSVGQILAILAELKLDEKTLVIFTSDNGPARRPAPPFRGSKASTFEGGVREPCIMRWTGRIPAGTTCDRIAGNIDVLPTFAALTGGSLPADRVLDGRDITSLMFDPAAGPVRTTQLYFNGAGHLDAIREGDWKLFLGDDKKRQQLIADRGQQAPLAKQPPLTPALFNLKADIAESTDLLAEQPDVAARLRKLADEQQAEITAHTRPAGQAAK